MNLDRRFAIIIGINDYNIKPLNYCVNDAKEVAAILEKKCFFSHDDIYVLTSDVLEPTKEISGRMDKCIEDLKKIMVPNQDSIFFYFAGHGVYQEERSNLQFHDIDIEIKSIFDKINLLNPKYQFYVIDACQSGGKIITRTQSKENIIDNYISNSSGILFMFASSENQYAFEESTVKHGLFTNYFLQAINNNAIYDDGILTTNRIQDYISKETSLATEFEQTPVIEARAKGYYPFAFNDLKLNENKRHKKATEISKIVSDSEKEIKEEYFPSIPKEKRQDLFEEINLQIDELLEENSFDVKDYSIQKSENLSVFDSYIYDELCKNIVQKSLKEKIISVENIFTVERKLEEPNRLLKSFSMLDSLFAKQEPKYSTDYYISFNDPSKILGRSIFFDSTTIQKVSAGVSFIIYQSLYGVGLATTSFCLNYDGYSDNKIKNMATKINAYLYNKNTVRNIFDDIKQELSKFDNSLKDWNKQRTDEIKDFAKKAKS